MANIVAIVGRPNVGKSTLFNRLVEERDAIIDNVSGVTRDRHYGKSQWGTKRFTVIDTGGYVYGSEDTFEDAIREQVEIAIEEASVILFVVDCISGLTPLDKDFSLVVRRSKKPVFLVANKADNLTLQQAAGEFYELGFEGEIYPISSTSGYGTGDLLDAVAVHLDDEPEEEKSDIPRIAIIGKPNVGKSSFVNALLNSSRSIVTDIAGTTRDAIDAHYTLFGKNFILTDTAGIRRKSRVNENIEFYSVLRAVKAIEKSDVCIVLLDASKGIEAQDLNIINLALTNKKGVVIMVNKWDLIEKDTNTAKKFEAQVRDRLGVHDFVPILFTSVVNKQRIFKVIETALEVFENKSRRIPTSKLNELLLGEIERFPPPPFRGAHVKIKYITQLPTKSPSFIFFCNYPNEIPDSYQRFIKNKLRENFGFVGVPITLFFRKK